jgi:hypothetical protein
MNNTQNIHKLDRQVTAEFHKGMQWHLQGYDCPSQDSPRKFGWLAAQEMDAIKKRYLQVAKDTFVDAKEQE